MDKPTEVQIKEFWLKWGLILHYPDGCYYEKSLGRQFAHDGTIDLNNLFKYAVPKLFDVKLARWDEAIWVAWVQQYENDVECEARDKDPALALFWAIWEVIKLGRLL